MSCRNKQDFQVMCSHDKIYFRIQHILPFTCILYVKLWICDVNFEGGHFQSAITFFLIAELHRAIWWVGGGGQLKMRSSNWMKLVPCNIKVLQSAHLFLSCRAEIALCNVICCIWALAYLRTFVLHTVFPFLIWEDLCAPQQHILCNDLFKKHTKNLVVV